MSTGRVVVVLAAALAAMSHSAGAQNVATGRNLAASCAMCHGTDGRSSSGYEPLAGMAQGDLVRKFNGYRSGAIPATVMHQIAKGYTDQQIQAIAEYFSAQKR